MARRLKELFEKDRMRVIGLISGTSCDGVDAALCEISGAGRDLHVELLAYETEPYSKELQRRVLAACRGETKTEDLCRLNFRVGQTFARAASKILKRSGLTKRELDLVGSHGQTVAHLPPRVDIGIGATGLIHKLGSTLQLGEAAMIAERMGVPVVSNFRTRDMAAAGQGAPLVPYVDYLLFSDPERTRAVINIGGISNITYLPAGGQAEDTLAFDTGPGNMIMDGLVQLMSRGRQRYDKDGEEAAQGRVDPYLLGELLKHEYLKREPPKSTGREEFGMAYAKQVYAWGIRRAVKPSSILRTATDFTAITLANAYKEFLKPRGPIEEIIISGGGARNPVLMRRLKKEFEGANIVESAHFGMPMKAKEAICFAVLARETVLGRPSNLPSATGAAGPRLLGQICPA